MSGSPLTVSELTAAVKLLIEESFPAVYVVGEVSNLVRARSGHVYLTLKDEGASLSCVLWRSAASRLRFEPEEGMEVLAQGRLNLYPPRGQYQLDIRSLSPRGLGALTAAFEQLKKKLAAEGLFDPERKRGIPALPRGVGVVTSPTGAAIRDILKVLHRRFPGLPVRLAPARVQGDGAAAEIAAAIALLNRREDLDVLIVGRGGGSLEDLWAFNEEPVARAIAASRLPVISAVGHEVDVTIADLVADLRAPTPSAAAELAVPSRAELLESLAVSRGRAARAMADALRRRRERLRTLAGAYGLRRFPDSLRAAEQRLDDLSARAARAARETVGRARDALARLAGRAGALSPLAVLARGYSVTTREDTGAPLTGIDGVAVGDRIRTRVARGGFVSRIEEKIDEEEG